MDQDPRSKGWLVLVLVGLGAAAIGALAVMSRDNASLLTVSTIGRLGYPKWLDFVIGSGLVLVGLGIVYYFARHGQHRLVATEGEWPSRLSIVLAVAIVAMISHPGSPLTILWAALAAVGAYAISVVGSFLLDQRSIAAAEPAPPNRVDVAVGSIVVSLLAVQVGALIVALVAGGFSARDAAYAELIGASVAVAGFVLAAATLTCVRRHPRFAHTLARSGPLAPLLFVGVFTSVVMDIAGEPIVTVRSGRAGFLILGLIIGLVVILGVDQTRTQGRATRLLKVGLVGGALATTIVGANMLGTSDAFHMGEITASYATAVANGFGNAFSDYVPIPGLLTVFYGGTADVLGDIAITLPVAIVLIQGTTAVAVVMLVGRAAGAGMALFLSPFVSLIFRVPPHDRFVLVLLAFVLLIQPEIRSRLIRFWLVGLLASAVLIVMVPATGLPFAAAFAIGASLLSLWTWRIGNPGLQSVTEDHRERAMWTGFLMLVVVGIVALSPLLAAAVKSTAAFASVNSYAFGRPLTGGGLLDALGKLGLIVLGTVIMAAALLTSTVDRDANRSRRALFLLITILFFVLSIPYSLGRVDEGVSRLNMVLQVSMVLTASAVAILSGVGPPNGALRSRRFIMFVPSLVLALGVTTGFTSWSSSAGSTVVWAPAIGLRYEAGNQDASSETLAAVTAMVQDDERFFDFSNRPAVADLAGIDFDGRIPHIFATVTSKDVGDLLRSVLSQDYDVVWLGPQANNFGERIPLRHWLVTAALFGSGGYTPVVFSGEEFLVADGYVGPKGMRTVDAGQLASYGTTWDSGQFGNGFDISDVPLLGLEPARVEPAEDGRFVVHGPPPTLLPAAFLRISLDCSTAGSSVDAEVSFSDGAGTIHRLSVDGTEPILPIGGIPAWQANRPDLVALEINATNGCTNPVLKSVEWGGVDLSKLGS